MKKFIKNNGLSLAFLLMFIASIAGQICTGHSEYNEELSKYGKPGVGILNYLISPHFLEATFENWESEFLQMALFVWLTIFLQQKGSSESKDFDKEEEVDREPSPARKDVPWPVKQGGFILRVYKHSLTLSLLLLFVLSFAVHFYGSFHYENEQLMFENKPLKSAGEYFLDSTFWFESFQNWQSEFLSVFAIIALSIYLRQIGSPQSKPVDAPHAETGE